MSQEEPFVHIHNFKSSLMRIYARPGAHDAALSAIKIAIPKILDEQFPGVLSFEENGSDMVERPPLPPRNAIKVQAPRTNKNDVAKLQDHRSHGDSDVEMTSPPPEQFYQQLPLADTTGHDFELELVTLRSKVDTLELENGELKKILKQRDEERVELTSRIDQTTQERDDLGRQRQSSQIKIRKLSGMIVKNSHSFDEPVDDDILQDMFKVRKNTACSLK